MGGTRPEDGTICTAEAVLKLPAANQRLDEVVNWCLACREGPGAVARLLVLDFVAETPGAWMAKLLEAAPALLAMPQPVSRIVSGIMARLLEEQQACEWLKGVSEEAWRLRVREFWFRFLIS